MPTIHVNEIRHLGFGRAVQKHSAKNAVCYLSSSWNMATKDIKFDWANSDYGLSDQRTLSIFHDHKQ